VTGVGLRPDDVRVDELRLLEAEAVHIIREVVAELTKPVLPIDTGHNVDESPSSVSAAPPSWARLVVPV
jgi:hypothetical protein